MSLIFKDTPETLAVARLNRQLQDIDNRFTYHPPKGDQAKRYGLIRGLGLDMAKNLVSLCPESRELSVALTKLDEVVFWANASIARTE